MVKETRFLFSTDEVLAVRMICSDCEGVTLYQFGRQEIPRKCSVCNEPWTGVPDSFFGIVRDFLERLERLKNVPAGIPVTLQFEIDSEG